MIYQKDENGNYQPLKSQIIISSNTPPTDTSLLWFDTINNVLKYYNPSSKTWDILPNNISSILYSIIF